ncbi:Copia protein [Senna tora]|uniref:Copia protein n=1 Tax=Senna tora TaxID=362788 RepID=A0A834U1G6_9FABA|nr:Copia protein [Senna tora]
MKELRQLNHFLGLEIDRDKEGIFLHQQRYSKDLLKKFGMLHCKPISTPMETNARMCAQEGKDLEDDLQQPIEYVVPLHCDNQSAIRLAENPLFHARTKHVEVHHHFLREKVLEEEVRMVQVKT